jgi:hypothetical protein
MKKYLGLTVLLFAFSSAYSQATRLVLHEHFTQASCGPCATYGPPYNALLAANPTKIAKISYQAHFPGTDPMNAANPGPALTRYNYYSASAVPRVYNQSMYGAGGSSPASVSQAQIDARYNTAPDWSVTVTHQLTSGYDSAQVVVLVGNATSSTLTSGTTGSLKLHLVMVEETITYPSPPGSNGETVFHDVMREMIPNANGTTLADSWTAGQSQSFQFKIPLPTYIANLGEVAFVAFVQDNSNKDIKNAAFSPKQAVSGLADASIASIGATTSGYCDPNLTPSVTFQNSGSVTITSATVSYTINGGTPVSQNWTGNLSAGQTATVSFPQVTLSTGANEIVGNVDSPNGTADYAALNNTSVPTTINILNNNPTYAPYDQNFEGLSLGKIPSNMIKEESVSGEMVGAISKANVQNLQQELGGWGQSASSLFWDFPTIASGTVISLITEKISLSTISNPNLYISTSYAARGGNSNDQLKVYVSTDCGSSWTNIFSPSGASLATGTDPGSQYRYWADPNKWLTHKISLSNYASSGHILLKFEGTSAAGQCLYLDNIWVSTNVLSEDEEDIQNNIRVFPNPSSDLTKFEITLANESEVSLAILNISGQKVLNIESQTFPSGNHIIETSVSDLPSGIYNAQISINGEIQNVRFTVSH